MRTIFNKNYLYTCTSKTLIIELLNVSMVIHKFHINMLFVEILAISGTDEQKKGKQQLTEISGPSNKLPSLTGFQYYSDNFVHEQDWCQTSSKEISWCFTFFGPGLEFCHRSSDDWFCCCQLIRLCQLLLPWKKNITLRLIIWSQSSRCYKIR